MQISERDTSAPPAARIYMEFIFRLISAHLESIRSPA